MPLRSLGLHTARQRNLRPGGWMMDCSSQSLIPKCIALSACNRHITFCDQRIICDVTSLTRPEGKGGKRKGVPTSPPNSSSSSLVAGIPRVPGRGEKLQWLLRIEGWVLFLSPLTPLSFRSSLVLFCLWQVAVVSRGCQLGYGMGPS